MSDDRPHAPSRHRIQRARDQGMAPCSGELSGGVGLLAAVLALGAWGDSVGSGLIEALQVPLRSPDVLKADATSFVSLARTSIGTVAVPVLGVIAAAWLGAVVTHQVQVGGLFVPSRALPDPSRAWSLQNGAGSTHADRLIHAGLLILKTAVLGLMAWWTIRGQLVESAGRFAVDPDHAAVLVRSFATALHDAALRFGLAMLALGLLDYAIQYRRFHHRLQTTPEQHREDQRLLEGDPALRARRRASWTQGISPATAPGETEAIGPS